MSKLTQFLQKAGLVESDDAPYQASPDPSPPVDPPAPPSDPPPRMAVRSSVSGPARFAIDDGGSGDASASTDPGSSPDPNADDNVLPEGVPIEQIYREASIPETSFPIERLQKLIEGLRQLDPTTQKAAVLAMDAADDAWTIEGVLKDAQAKTDALHAYGDRVTAKATQIQGNIEREIASMTTTKDSSIADIQAQIADLQKKLEATASQHATDITGLSGKRTAAQQAAERERQRVSETISKINNLIHPFLSSASNR